MNAMASGERIPEAILRNITGIWKTLSPMNSYGIHRQYIGHMQETLGKSARKNGWTNRPVHVWNFWYRNARNEWNSKKSHRPTRKGNKWLYTSIRETPNGVRIIMGSFCANKENKRSATEGGCRRWQWNYTKARRHEVRARRRNAQRMSFSSRTVGSPTVWGNKNRDWLTTMIYIYIYHGSYGGTTPTEHMRYARRVGTGGCSNQRVPHRGSCSQSIQLRDETFQTLGISHQFYSPAKLPKKTVHNTTTNHTLAHDHGRLAIHPPQRFCFVWV